MQSTTPEPHASGPLRVQQDLVGRELVGRFRILAKLGEGGMGAVYRGEQMSLKRAVAIKVLRPELSANQMLLRRFEAEAMGVAKLDHPNTVKVYDFGQDTDGSLFIAMELVDGQSLRAVMTKAGPLPPVRAFNIALQCAASLVDAHASQIVHRDLKPDNVMLVDKGKQRDVVRVLDFGIAKLRDDSRATQQAMTQAGDMLGTPQYMAPEQIKGEAIDGRTDLYALGCMIYEMVTARLPFEAPTIMAMLSKHLVEPPTPPSQRRPDLNISPAIDQVVMAALHKEPAERPANMEQYAEMLAGVLAQFPLDPQWSPGSRGMAAQNTPGPMPVASPQGPSAALSVPTVATGFSPPAAMAPTPAPPTTPIPPTARVAPQPYSPFAAAPPVHAQPQHGHALPPPPPPPKGNTMLYVFLGVGLLGIAAVAFGIYTAFSDAKKKSDKKDDYKAKFEKSDDVTDPPDKPDKDEPDPPKQGSGDPWKTDDSQGSLPRQPSRPTPQPSQPRPAKPQPPPSVGTAMTAVPSAAHFNLPAGFTSMDLGKPGWKSFANQEEKVVVALLPLPAGSNDPAVLKQMWLKENAEDNLTFTSMVSNQGHPMLRFTGNASGNMLTEYLTLYITDRYRLGFIVIAETSNQNDVVGKLIYSGVTWPPE